MELFTCSRILLIAFLALVCGGLCYHMLTLTPPIIDDYWYHYRILENRYTTLPINNWRELVETVYSLREGRLAKILFIVVVFIGSFPLLEILDVVFLLPAVMLPFVAGSTSTGGGVYFYVCLFMLILVLPYASHLLIEKNRYLSVFSLAAPLLVMVRHYPKIRQIHHDYTAILQRAQKERIVGCDLYHDTDMWKMITSLPHSASDPLYWWIGKLHGCQNFYVVFNTDLKDKTVYDLFKYDDNESPSW